MCYDVEIVRDRGRLRQFLPEWRSFMDRATRGRGLYSDPAMAEYELSGDGVMPYIVIVRRGKAIQCIAPFRVLRSRLRLQFSVFQLASFSTRLMTLLGSDFVFAEDADESTCCEAAFSSLDASEFDLSFLNAIDVDGPLWRYCSARERRPGELSFARPSEIEDSAFRLELPADFAKYASMLGSNTRSSLKRRIKKLISSHSAVLVKVTEAADVRGFLDHADAIFSDSWQAKTYGPVKKNSAADVARLEHMARHGWLRSYLLMSEMGPLAFQIGYHYGDTFYACDFAFAQKWAHLGSGASLMYLMLEELYEHGPPRVVDLGAGDSPQKRTFRSSPRKVGDYYVVSRNRWRLVIAAQRWLSSVEASARSALVRLRLDGRIRRFLKHKT
jgi:hypothetical protein